MMGVDAPARQKRGHVVGQDLHITRQHHQFGAAVCHDLADLRFLLRLYIAGDREIVIGNEADHRDRERLLWVIADDTYHVHVQFTGAVPIQQVAKAMIELADQHQNFTPCCFVAQRQVHAILRGSECRDQQASSGCCHLPRAAA